MFGPASLVSGKLSSERERMAAQLFPTRLQERNAKLLEEANSSWYKDNRKLGPGEWDDEDDDDAQERARVWGD
ncbi:PP2A regulatory subunit like [Actinidia chinensis var. chinensis]|uniref:PP2A regulatory subunit like n=1 Tax=Actinidia chinensis var. chinensis TaxID=1590841 RepID=A0A2R6Q992_ACTCC|nr:PP2A regulatory subunit like [Actinidia chinensis var. chinensis]